MTNNKIDRLQDLFNQRSEAQKTLREVEGEIEILTGEQTEVAGEAPKKPKTKKKETKGSIKCPECGNGVEKLRGKNRPDGGICNKCYNREYQRTKAKEKREEKKNNNQESKPREEERTEQNYKCLDCGIRFESTLSSDEAKCPKNTGHSIVQVF